MLSCFPFLLQYFLPSFFPYFLCLELEAKEKAWHINIRKDLIEMIDTKPITEFNGLYTQRKKYGIITTFFLPKVKKAIKINVFFFIATKNSSIT